MRRGRNRQPESDHQPRPPRLSYLSTRRRQRGPTGSRDDHPPWTVRDTPLVPCADVDGVPEDLHSKVPLPTVSGSESVSNTTLDRPLDILQYLENYHYASRKHVVLFLYATLALEPGASTRSISTSTCRSSRSPHNVRSGRMTTYRRDDVLRQVVGDRLNASAQVLDTYYDRHSER